MHVLMLFYWPAVSDLGYLSNHDSVTMTGDFCYALYWQKKNKTVLVSSANCFLKVKPDIISLMFQKVTISTSGHMHTLM